MCEHRGAMSQFLPIPECIRHSAQPGLPKTGPQAIHWRGGRRDKYKCCYFFTSILAHSLCSLYIYVCVCVSFFFFLPHHMACGTSPTRDWTCASALEAWSFNHWTTREIIHSLVHICWASLVAQIVRIRLPVQEMQVRSLGWEDPLEKEMAIQYSVLV